MADCAFLRVCAHSGIGMTIESECVFLLHLDDVHVVEAPCTDASFLCVQFLCHRGRPPTLFGSAYVHPVRDTDHELHPLEFAHVHNLVLTYSNVASCRYCVQETCNFDTLFSVRRRAELTDRV